VLAELLRGQVKVVLFESTAKKCRFLQAVADKLELAVDIRNTRIEEAEPARFDVVTARACAPLARLLGYAHKFMGKQTIGLFLKGRSLEAELTDAHKSWTMAVRQHQSATDASGVILEVRGLVRG
jgi:16S rRNA (guanine527-N7)-methyltransferase